MLWIPIQMISSFVAYNSSRVNGEWYKIVENDTIKC